VSVDPAKVLFVGLGATPVAWYRCIMPAMHLGADWIGVANEPPDLKNVTGLVKGTTPGFSEQPTWSNYEIVVLQQPRGPAWRRLIKGLRSQGIKVVYEIDDYVHGIHEMKDHDFSDHFTPRDVYKMVECMKVCDGIFCSTEFIARQYGRYAPIYVCENGLDVGRYNVTRPPRPTTNIGWAGATGHVQAMLPWLQQIAEVMAAHEDTCFVSIGQNFADAFKEAFPSRAISIPFTMIDIYPAAMTMLDIAVAPAREGSWYDGKSDLRWLEAGALGIPIIADPRVYPKITHGVDGFHASSPKEMRELVEMLLAEPETRVAVGEAARTYVHSKRDMRVAVKVWADALDRVAS
jgi:glycosyltransferase involved in cell wall biosynthesis